MIIKAPSSKSYAQRAVAAALLAHGRTTLRGVDLSQDMSDDTRAAIEVAKKLGARIVEQRGKYYIDGRLRPRSSEINIGESGLSTRLFTPIAALCGEPITITGRGSIMRRPMELMIKPLQDLGVEISSNNGYLPITVCGALQGGRTIEVDGSLSSQFLTGLLMALPLADGDTTLIVNNLQSKPYIDITLSVLRDFGVEVSHTAYEKFYIAGNQHYTATNYTIEGDWSGASCLLVLRAISGLDFEVSNLNADSVQADRAIERAIALATANGEAGGEASSKLRGFDFDATHCPDLFPALVALAAHCRGESRLVGTERLTHKESDRATALRDEFAKLGVSVDISEPNVMRVLGGCVASGAVIDPHGDHRIAMAAAVAAWDREVSIEDRDVVNKSYPAFWEDLAMAASSK